MDIFSGLLLLLITAFFAATLFPAQSELVLSALYLSGDYQAWQLLTVASIGNVAGSVVNWMLGRFLVHYQDRTWFPVSKRALHSSQATFTRHGQWTLLFAWVPYIGDPLTLVAGICRVRILPFLILVTIGKVGRYMLILAAL